MYARRSAKRGALVAIALGAIVGGATPWGHAPSIATAAADAPVSAQNFLSMDDVTVPDRSQAYPERSATSSSCGTTSTDARYAIDGDPADWLGEPTWINGTGRYDGGEYVWTDYPFDDAGTGKFRYPGEAEASTAREGGVATVSPRMQRYGANAADLVDVRVAADADFLYLRATTNFLNATDSTVLGFGLDTTPGEAFSEWPRGARVRTEGLDAFVTLVGGCGWLTTASGETDLPSLGGAAAVDLGHNTFEAAIPLSSVPSSASGDVTLVGGAGLWDVNAQTWLAPVTGGLNTNSTDTPTGAATASDPAVFNLTFRREPMIDANDVLDTGSSTSSKRVFQTRHQEEILLTGTTGDAALTLQLDLLQPGATTDPLPIRPPSGDVDFTRTYRSRIDLEGIIYVGQQLVYLSRYQPYAVHVPANITADRPLAVMFHGGDGSHVNELSEEAGLRVAAELEGRSGAITLAPLGRGRRQPWWRGLGEADVLEAIHAVRSAYQTDPNRQLATGASLGGYATIRLSSLYPELWAGAVASCPAEYENSTSTREIGNELPQTQYFVVDEVMPSLLQVPFRQISGTGDPLVRIDSGHRMRDKALAAGLDVGYTEYPNSSHCFLVPSIAGGWMDNHAPEMAMLLTAGRRERPARVRYVVDPRHYPAATEVIGIADVRDIGLGYSGAYWLSGLSLRPEAEAAAEYTGTAVAGNTIGGPGTGVIGQVDATSHAIDGWALSLSSCGESAGLAGTGTGGNPYATPDSGGSSGLTWNNPNYWRCQAQSWTGGVEPLLELSTSNLDELTVDLAGAGLDGFGTFDVSVTGDGPITIRLLGASGATAAGSCLTATGNEAASLVLSVEASTEACTLRVVR